jgi:TRAP transporter TAXI family solute receptor
MMVGMTTGRTAVRASRARSAVLTAVLAVACGAGLLGCGGPEPAQLDRDLVVSTGNPGGVYDVYGAALAQGLTARQARTVSARHSDGSVQNVRRVASGTADEAFTLADVAASAVAGKDPFTTPIDLCSVARLYDNYVQLVVLAESPITTVAHLRGRVVAIGSRGSGTTLVAERLLRNSGLVPDRDVTAVNLDIVAASISLGTGQVDAMFWSGGLPTASISQLADRRQVRLVSLQSAAQQLIDSYGNVYRRSMIPASSYHVSAPVPTLSVANYLVTSCSQPDSNVTATLDLLFDPAGGVRSAHPEAERLNRRSAIATGDVPLHPAAVRWFRDHSP